LFDAVGVPATGGPSFASWSWRRAASPGSAIRRRTLVCRFGGALAFLAAAFSAEAIVPWVPLASRFGMVLRAVLLLSLPFAVVRGLFITADVSARARTPKERAAGAACGACHDGDR
jgi:hypothetical protein